MTESPRRDGTEPTRPMGNYSGYNDPGPSDPAYASQAYGPSYPATPPSPPTDQYPPYGAPPGYHQYPPEAPPPEPKLPVWLWLLAGLAILVVIGLVLALLISNRSSQDTMVAPPPTATEPTYPTPSPPPTIVHPPRTVVPPLPAPTTGPTTPAPPGTATPGATEPVVYEVTGDGRAINITYVDTGGVLQTEFNVLLPWSKTVQLPSPAASSASVSIINVGRDVTCTVSVDGAQIQQRTGSGLTICVASG